MDQWLIALAALIFTANFLFVLADLRQGTMGVSHRGLIMMATGFACQSAVLWMRGQALGRCPMTTGSEVLLFVSWAVVLWYFILGPSYRLSLLGIFTSAMVAVMQAVALIPALNRPADTKLPGPANPWVELHGSLSLLSYGAFGVAALAGVMYLLQDHQLKRRHHSAVFFHLPPINHLFRAMMLLVTLGCLMLAIGMLVGYSIGRLPPTSKLWAAYAVLGVYACLILTRWRGVSHRRVAMGAVATFIVAVSSLWFI